MYWYYMLISNYNKFNIKGPKSKSWNYAHVYEDSFDLTDLNPFAGQYYYAILCCLWLTVCWIMAKHHTDDSTKGPLITSFSRITHFSKELSVLASSSSICYHLSIKEDALFFSFLSKEEKITNHGLYLFIYLLVIY